MNRPEIVVTGMGAVSCLGAGADALWQGLMARECGIRPLARLDASAHRIAHGGEVRGFPLAEGDEAIQFAAAACGEAVRQAGLSADELAETAVVLGTNFGALTSFARFHEMCLRTAGEAHGTHVQDDGSASGTLAPQTDHDGGEASGTHEHDDGFASGTLAPLCREKGRLFREMLPFGPTEAVARRLGLGGMRTALSLSCASGNAAFVAALAMLRRGGAARVVAGGYDAITEVAWSGLAAMRTMTADVLRPFDKRRNGTIFSEGAGALVLERREDALARGAEPLAVLAGGATDNNAYHMAHPDPGGEGMARVMAAALEEAGLAPDAVDYVSAHGTGTQYNDKLETLALKQSLGERARRIPAVSIKSSVGHAMGAASALEVVATVQAVRRGRIPATLNLEEPDPECDLDYCPDGPRDLEIRAALCNSAGIGGPNAAVVLKRWDNRPRS